VFTGGCALSQSFCFWTSKICSQRRSKVASRRSKTIFRRTPCTRQIVSILAWIVLYFLFVTHNTNLINAKNVFWYEKDLHVRWDAYPHVMIITVTIFMVLSSWIRAIARVLTVHLMNAHWVPTLRPSQPTLAASPSIWQLPSTSTIAIYHYYSAQKLILILPSHRG